MASTSETGHAKNVANFKKMISFCIGYDSKYNPVRPALTLPGLNNLLSAAQQCLLNIKTAKTAFDNYVNVRAVVFEGLPVFCTRLVRFLSSCDVTAEALDDAKGHLRKIRGQRATPIPKTDEGETEASENQQDKHISVSQTSYDNLLDNFKSLVLTAISQAGYQVNEADFTPEGLQQKVDALTRANHDVIDAYTAWSNTRIERNKILYNKLTGLKKTAQDVKNYVAGVFTMSSEEYKQISGLTFTDLKK
jgi:hypothetical protein